MFGVRLSAESDVPEVRECLLVSKAVVQIAGKLFDRWAANAHKQTIANLCVLDKIPYVHHHRSNQIRGVTESMSLFKELKRRNVFRVGAAYIVAAWLVIQVVETLFPVYGLSDAAIRIVVAILGVGFIPSLIISWVF